MDRVIRYIAKEVNLTEAEADAGNDPWEVVEDVLYKGTPDKVLSWLRTAEAAPTAEYVVLESRDGEDIGNNQKLTIEQYQHKHVAK